MLKQLHVQNFAIIEDINTEFKDGMTALTGGTGAGKSLIIYSLGLLLGGRADADLIRHGASKAIVQGTFTPNERVNDLLKALGLPCCDELLIEREIFPAQKNVVKVNNVAVSLNDLKKITQPLADIHAQNETFRLINPDNYLSLLDQFGNDDFKKKYNDYQMDLTFYRESYSKYNSAMTKSKNLNDKIDLLKFQYNELESLNIKQNEENELAEIIQKLGNFDKLYNELNLAYQIIDGENSSLNSLYEAATHVSKVAEFDGSFKESQERMFDFYYELDEIKSHLKNEIDSLDFNPDTLNNAEARLQDLRNIKKKYRKTIEELIQYKEDIKDEINLQENFDDTIKEFYQNVLKAYNQTIKSAKSLSDLRRGIALNLEKRLVEELKDLDLAKTAFKIDFSTPELNDPLKKDAFNESGIDNIDFLISLNPGEPLKPLSKVASGGEISRIMLAFKAIFSENIGISLIVFDEIDMGISGYVASQVAKKMKQISKKMQVLCITHLPQVAGIADNHIHIEKILEDGRTKTQLKYLDKESRIKEIAMMLSGDCITSGAIIAAKELLQ